jgi:hypothetical protein
VSEIDASMLGPAESRKVSDGWVEARRRSVTMPNSLMGSAIAIVGTMEEARFNRLRREHVLISGAPLILLN